MATVLKAPPADGPSPWPVTAQRYYRMIEAGVLGKSDRVYLRHGQLVEKMTKNPPHAHTVARLTTLFARLLPAGYLAFPEQPVEITGYHVPEPDVSILRGHWDDYSNRTPALGDVALIIEVADSSLADDRGQVLIDYATAAIPIYWIVNLIDRRVEVYSGPIGPSYGLCTIYRPGEMVPVDLDGQQIGHLAVDEVLPRKN
jgi:hypothetical protein